MTLSGSFGEAASCCRKASHRSAIKSITAWLIGSEAPIECVSWWRSTDLIKSRGVVPAGQPLTPSTTGKWIGSLHRDLGRLTVYSLPFLAPLKTVLTNITLSSASGGAALAFFNALVKALPNVLEVEPSDIGYTVAFEGGVATLTVYDSIEGGLGISTRVPEVLPELLHEVRRLLRIGFDMRL